MATLPIFRLAAAPIGAGPWQQRRGAVRCAASPLPLLSSQHTGRAAAYTSSSRAWQQQQHQEKQQQCAPASSDPQQQPCSSSTGTPIPRTTRPAARPPSNTLLLPRRAALAAAAAAAATLCLPLAQPLPAAAGALVDEAVATAAFEAASPAVVALAQSKTRPGGGESLEPLGSGLVWDDLGHLVTNYHVISQFVLDRSGAAGVRVVVQGEDGTQLSLPANIIGTDATRDLAVLSLSEAPPSGLLRPLPVASSSALQIGQSVYAVGARCGEGRLMTAGVVSGLQRAIPAPTGTRIYGVIQTDASINAVLTGGALVDSFGHLVGLSSAVFTNKSTLQGRGSGVSFALPSDMLREVVPNLIIYGAAAGKGVRSG